MNNNKETLKSRRDHYVQQAYLKNFACNEKKTYIWMMDKRQKIIFKEPQEIRECAQYRFFYPIELEEWLAKNIENDGIRAKTIHTDKTRYIEIYYSKPKYESSTDTGITQYPRY